ncbi:MAG: helix-turn-helix transcriptional regulator [Acidimicrobiales bacterium]
MDQRRTSTEWSERLGAQVRQRRISADLTQEELADLADISVSAVSNLETGAGAQLSTFVKVVRALGASDWLDTLAPAPPSISPIQMLRHERRAGRPRQRVRKPSRS